MKARVKGTGDIIDVLYKFQTVEPNPVTKYETLNGERYFEEDVEFFEDGTPDYWTRLEHQYAGMAMQGLLANPYLMKEINDFLAPELHIAKIANEYATALVERMKQKED